MSEYKHWCGNCQINLYLQRHYGRKLTWQDCPYTCKYATEMRHTTEATADPDADKVARDIATIIENEKDMRVILQNADRTATWVPEPDRRNHWHCSKCGYVIGILKVDAKYCLNCGCKMREGEDNETRSDI